MIDILNNDANPRVGEEIDDIEHMDMNQDDELNVSFFEQPSTPHSEATSTSRKRCRNSGDALVETLSSGFDLMEKGFKEVTMELAAQVRCVAHKANIAEKVEKLWEELTKVPGFTEEKMAKAAILIGKDETMLIMFPTLPPNVKDDPAKEAASFTSCYMLKYYSTRTSPQRRRRRVLTACFQTPRR